MSDSGHGPTLPAQDDPWMAYIQSEVVAMCAGKGWAHRIRRREEAREKPVAASRLEDYEWKLVPGAGPGAASDGYEGTYYVLRLAPTGRFELLHDNVKAGDLDNLTWLTNTATEFGPFAAAFGGDPGRPSAPPPQGWLARMLEFLTGRFQPNTFSYT
jgi:hypothetical protein